MTDQKDAWEKEYKNDKDVPTTSRTRPSSAVVKGLQFLKDTNLLTGINAIDLGCGNGRNSFFLVEQGFTVTAVDFIEGALEKVKEGAQELGISDHIATQNVSLTDPLPFEDNTFDLALDVTTSISLNDNQLKFLAGETKRILKPNGIIIFYNLSSNDEYYVARGDNQGTYKTDTDIIDYCRSEDEIKEIYKDWDFLEMEEVAKNEFFYDKEYTRKLWRLILQNKK